jgi:hypothetical protein
MENIIVKDICEVYAVDSEDNVYFLGLTNSTDITQTVQTDEIRAGIGNGVINRNVHDKSITFSVATGIHSDSIYAMQSGTEFTDGTYTVHKNEKATLTTGKLTIVGTPSGTSALAIDKHGKQFVGTITGQDVTITGGTEGEKYTVIYPSVVTGQILSLRSDKFPKNYSVELRTIAIDNETNEQIADLFWVFKKAQPDGGLKASLKAGSNANDEITFTALLPGDDKEYGKYIVVPVTPAA